MMGHENYDYYNTTHILLYLELDFSLRYYISMVFCLLLFYCYKRYTHTYCIHLENQRIPITLMILLLGHLHTQSSHISGISEEQLQKNDMLPKIKNKCFL